VPQLLSIVVPSLVASLRGERTPGWQAQRSDIDVIVEDAWRWHCRLRAA
jgi:UDP-glucose 4-epimerase